MRTVVLLLCCVVLASTASPKASDLSKQILNARFVAIVVLTVNDKPISEYSPKMNPDDRQVRAAVEDEIRKWKRFTVLADTHQADLLIAVRAGRRGSITTGTQIGIGDRGPYDGTTGSAEVGPIDDQLLVYGGSDFDSPVLWRGQQSGGLGGKLPLLARFKDEIEKAAAAGSKKKP